MTRTKGSKVRRKLLPREYAWLLLLPVGLFVVLIVVTTVRFAEQRIKTPYAAAPIVAEAGTATQTDWSEGPGQTTFSDPTKFDSASSINYSTPGQLTLASTPVFSPDSSFSPGGAERQIDDDPDNAYPMAGGTVAMLTNGNYVYAWPQEYCAGCNLFPTAAVVGPDGTSVVAPFAVTDTGSASLRSTSGVSVTDLPNGRFVVTWTVPGGKTLIARFEADGTALDGFGTAANVCTTYCRQWGHALTSDTSGNFYFVSESGPSKLRVNGFDQNGDKLFATTGPLDGEIGHMGVAVAPNGNIVVTWSKTTDGRVYAQTFSVPADPLDPATSIVGPFLVDLGTGWSGSAIGAYPAYAPDGTLYVTYVKHETTCGGEPGHVFISKFDDAGVQVGSTFEVGTTGFADGCWWDQAPALEFLENSGAYVVAWSEFENAGETFGGFIDVYTQTFDASDTALSPVTLLSTHSTTDEVYPSLAIDQSGLSAVYAWQDWIDSLSSDGQVRGVVYDIAAYDPSGTLTSSVFDAGSGMKLTSVLADQTVPAGTTSTIAVRSGNTPTPDSSWTSFATIDATAVGQAAVSSNGRYSQYQLTLTTTGTNTPTVRSITMSAGPAGVTRISGADPTEQSINVSLERFPTTGSAELGFITRDELLIDSFTATPLVSRTNGTLLLNDSTQLEPTVLTELQRAVPAGGPVIIVGGSKAVSPAVEDAIEAAGFSTLRVGGIDRRETAAKLSRELVARNGSATTKCFLSEDQALVDALGAGPVAGSILDGTADCILLSQRGSTALDTFTEQFLVDHPQLTSLELLGGPVALPAAIQSSLSAFPNLSVTRVEGANRYATNVALVQKYYTNPTSLIVASGQKDSIPGAQSVATLSNSSSLFFDALLAGPLAAQNQSPLIIVATSVLPDEIAAYLASVGDSVTSVIIVGSEAEVSTAVEQAIIDALQS